MAQPERLFSRGCLLGCVFPLLGTVIALGVWVWTESRRGWTAERLESVIAKEVPAGCDRTEVQAWFDKHNIAHGHFTDTTDADSDGKTMPMLAGLRDEDLGGMELGNIMGREANVGFVESGMIFIYFFFDRHGHCVGHLVRKIHLSL